MGPKRSLEAVEESATISATAFDHKKPKENQSELVEGKPCLILLPGASGIFSTVMVAIIERLQEHFEIVVSLDHTKNDIFKQKLKDVKDEEAWEKQLSGLKTKVKEAMEALKKKKKNGETEEEVEEGKTVGMLKGEIEAIKEKLAALKPKYCQSNCNCKSGKKKTKELIEYASDSDRSYSV